MKKPYKFSETTMIVCSTKGCNTKIKANVAHRKKGKPLICYSCHVKQERGKGHLKDTIKRSQFKKVKEGILPA